jgi:hypothetical protein
MHGEDLVGLGSAEGCDVGDLRASLALLLL